VNVIARLEAGNGDAIVTKGMVSEAGLNTNLGFGWPGAA